MAVDVALDGAAALDKAAVTAYDVIVLDRDLPVVHGDEECRRLAQEPVRILMLTAARAVPDRIEGLAMGADDYLPKPFAFGELVARVRALARRAGVPAPPLLVAGDVVVDPARRLAFRNGGRLALARRSSPFSRSSSPPTERSCPPRNCWSGRGTTRSIPLPGSCA